MVITRVNNKKYKRQSKRKLHLDFIETRDACFYSAASSARLPGLTSDSAAASEESELLKRVRLLFRLHISLDELRSFYGTRRSPLQNRRSLLLLCHWLGAPKEAFLSYKLRFQTLNFARRPKNKFKRCLKSRKSSVFAAAGGEHRSTSSHIERFHRYSERVKSFHLENSS